MKKFNLITTLAAFVALAAGMHGSVAAADTRLRIAGQHPANHFATTTLKWIRDELEGAGVGLDVTIYPSGQLGNGQQVFGDVSRGVIDIGHTFVYSNSDPRLEMNSIPYLVSDYDEMERVFSPGSTFYDTFGDLLAEQNIKLLGVYVEGFIGVVTKPEPDNPTTTSPKGVNIRVWSAEAARSATETLGFGTTTMSYGDVVPAIQQGTVGGMIGLTAEGYYTQLRDVVNYYIPYNAFVENTAYYMNEGTWNKLNEEQRKVVRDTFRAAASRSISKAKELDRKYTAKLDEAGVEVIDLSAAQRAEIAETVREETWPLLKEKLGADLLQKLRTDND